MLKRIAFIALFMQLFVNNVAAGDGFDFGDIKVKCACDDDNSGWKIEKIDPNWITKLGIFPPKLQDIVIKDESNGALGETRTPTS